MEIRNLSLNDVIKMGELLEGQEEFITEMKRVAGILYIMKKTDDPDYTIEKAYELTIGELQDEFPNKPTADAAPKTRRAAAKVGR